MAVRFLLSRCIYPTTALPDHEIRVCFATPDSNLADALKGVLGAGFVIRTFSDAQPNRFGDLKEWSDVVLLDLRATT